MHRILARGASEQTLSARKVYFSGERGDFVDTLKAPLSAGLSHIGEIDALMKRIRSDLRLQLFFQPLADGGDELRGGDGSGLDSLGKTDKVFGHNSFV